jgi:Domain of unknown function (DUF4372)
MRYDDGTRSRTFSHWDQYLTMAFAQLTYRESLRDIESCLRSVTGKLYHLGFRGKVARTTLPDANESRDWRIFAYNGGHKVHSSLLNVARLSGVRHPLT